MLGRAQRRDLRARRAQFIAIWATIVIRRNIESMLTRFHKFSILVWIIWLVPYFGGMFLAMGH